MKIVVDIASLQSESRYRGIGRYGRGLLSAMARNAGEHEIWLVVNLRRDESIDDIRTTFDGLISKDRIVGYHCFDNISYKDRRTNWRRAASELVRDHFLLSLKPDAILATSMFEGFSEDIVTGRTSLLASVPYITIGYDLIPLLAPETYLGAPEVRDWYMEKLATFKSSNAILAISASAATEISELLSLPPESVRNISAAADGFSEVETDESRWENAAAQYGICDPYFVYTASYEPRKNFEGLLKAFASFQRSSSKQHQLVLVTSNDAHTMDGIRGLLMEYSLTVSEVIVTGFIADADLKAFYTNCEAMVYVSKHEGFGLPVLEAMHCGAPVIGSDCSSISEIIEWPEAMFDPENHSAISDMMMRVTTDADFRTKLRKNSICRRVHFTWDGSAIAAWEAIGAAVWRTPHKKLPATVLQNRLITELKSTVRSDGPVTEDDLQSLATMIADNLDLTEAMTEQIAPQKRTWRIEGPFDSTYSLALLNRETARALAARDQVVQLKSTEGPGDYDPNEAFLSQAHPDIYQMWKDTDDNTVAPDVVSRNLYPPRVNDMEGELRLLHHYAWEESRFPTQWVNDFNENLDGLTCLSRHVKKVLQDSGVRVPMHVSGCGVDHWERVTATEDIVWPGKGFRFLHVSSCFPRKGPDVLIEAYGRAFRKSDDVSLIVKTFPNPHNNIAEIIETARLMDPDYPDVELILTDLSDGELKSLYAHSHVLVAPSRAEGYGLPMAEAMLTGLPVVTTGWSGQLDFCNENNSWLVDFDFAPAETHFNLPSSVWAEPDVEDLAVKLQMSFEAGTDKRQSMASDGRLLLLGTQKWSDVITKLNFAADKFSSSPERAIPKIGIVTTWNCRCGIAAASEHLVQHFDAPPIIFAAKNDERMTPDGVNVKRCWNKDTVDETLEDLAFEVYQTGVQALIIQFNYGFFDFNHLEAFVAQLRASGIVVFFFLHSTSDPVGRPDKELSLIRNALVQSDCILVHSHHDLNRLKRLDAHKNAALFPLGIIGGHAANFAVNHDTFTIASFGFCLPHKGLLNLVNAFAELSPDDNNLRLDLVNAVYPVSVSHELADTIKEQIKAHGLEATASLTTDYLSDEDALARLQSADLIIFPYEQTGESASAAVRLGIASGSPVACSKLSIFHDVAAITFPIDGEDVSALVVSLKHLIAQLKANGSEIGVKQEASHQWRNEHEYSTLALRLQSIVESHYRERQYYM